MHILSVSEAQGKFTKILNNLKESILIVDKKSNKEKAVILSYDEYIKLTKNKKKRSFKDFVGVLDKDFKTDDPKYNAIVK